MSVELDMDGVQGGALFDWFISSPGGYVRRYNHLSEWLEDITAAVERGAYKRSEHADGMWLIIPNSYQLDQYGETGPLAGPHPNYHSPYVNDGDWPQHWRDAADMFRFGE
jgi:hypothetical protein